MEKEFEIYINKIVKNLDCTEKEKSEVAEEIRDHLYMLKREYLEKGYYEEKAVELSISTFGNEKKISSDIQEVMFPYVKYVKLFGTILCGLLTILLFNKGINLLNIKDVDGGGIGIYFLSFEINDRVPVQSIPNYAISFFVASLITALVPLVLYGKNILKQDSKELT